MDYARIIKEQISSREVLEGMGVRVDRHGMACCPFHGEKTASLKVYQDMRRGWHCYGCGRGGSVIDLVMLERGVGFRDAMKAINEDYALGLPIGRPLRDAERREVAAEIARRQAERERREMTLRDAESAYWAAYDAWMACDRTIAEKAPHGPLEEPDEDFIYAVTHRAEIKEELDAAEIRWAAARAG